MRSVCVSRLMLVCVCVLLVSGSWLAVEASVVSSDRSLAGGLTVVRTRGALTPVRPRDYVNFTVLGGKPWQVKVLSALFSKSGVQLFAPGFTLPLFNVSFKIVYAKVLALRLRPRYASSTLMFGKDGFAFLRNKVHTVIVQGFTGVLFFNRAKLRTPARFEFVGVAQNVTIIH